jgi:adenylosuccinate synthase
MPGWTEDITGIDSYKDLPANAKSYVEKLEELLGVDITGVSVGPGREQTLFRD